MQAATSIAQAAQQASSGKDAYQMILVPQGPAPGKLGTLPYSRRSLRKPKSHQPHQALSDSNPVGYASACVSSAVPAEATYQKPVLEQAASLIPMSSQPSPEPPPPPAGPPSKGAGGLPRAVPLPNDYLIPADMLQQGEGGIPGSTQKRSPAVSPPIPAKLPTTTAAASFSQPLGPAASLPLTLAAPASITDPMLHATSAHAAIPPVQPDPAGLGQTAAVPQEWMRRVDQRLQQQGAALDSMRNHWLPAILHTSSRHATHHSTASRTLLVQRGLDVLLDAADNVPGSSETSQPAHQKALKERVWHLERMSGQPKAVPLHNC